MPHTWRLAGFVVALGCVACAEPVSPPLPQQAVVSMPVDPPQRSCDDPLPRSMEGPSAAASDAPRCMPQTKGGFVLDPHLFDSRYDFGHAPAAHDFEETLEEQTPTRSRQPRAPASVTQRCGYHLLNKVAVPFCLRLSP